jgi:hypothetical protein
VSGTALVRYEAARQALAECVRVDEAKDIRDKAAAMAAYARQRDDKELEVWVSEIYERACIRIGQISRELETAERTRTDLHPDGRMQTKTSVLAAAGIPTSTAYDYEQLAGGKTEQGQRAAEAAVDAYFARARANTEPVTREGLRGVIREALHEAFPDAQPATRKPRLAPEDRPSTDHRYIDFTGAISAIMRIEHFDAAHIANRARDFPMLFDQHRAEAIGAIERIEQYLAALDRGDGTNGSAQTIRRTDKTTQQDHRHAEELSH